MIGKNKKIRILCLDGATPQLIFPWANSGDLRNFHEILKNGSYGELESVMPPITASAWASFNTGVGIDKHRIYHFVKITKNYLTNVNVFNNSTKKLWNILNKADVSTGIYNLPMSYPPSKVDGFIVCGWIGAPSEGFMHPEYLKNELRSIERQFLNGPVKSWIRQHPDKQLEELHNILEMEYTKIKYLLKKFDTDLFIAYFNHTDIIQHFFWKYMDPTHPHYDKSNSKKYKDAIFNYFVDIDKKLVGYLLEKTNKNDILMIVSDHGFGPLHKKFNVNVWLKKIGLLKIHKKSFKTRSILHKIFNKINLNQETLSILLKRYISKNLINNVPSNLKALIPNPSHKTSLNPLDIQWEKTKAFADSSSYYGIYINLNGKFIKGCVNDVEYERVREFIIKELYNLYDPEYKTKVVEKVWKTEDLFPNAVKYTYDFPDIIFQPKDFKYKPYFDLTSDKVIELDTGIRSGDHRMYGIIAIKGEGIKKDHKIKKAHITDIAPTILHMFGLPIPKYMDGRVLTEIFRPGSEFAKRKVRYTSYEKEILRGRVKRLRAKRKI